MSSLLDGMSYLASLDLVDDVSVVPQDFGVYTLNRYRGISFSFGTSHDCLRSDHK